MPLVDFPSDVPDNSPTFLVGGNATLNAGAGGPSKAPVGATGLTAIAAADATALRNAAAAAALAYTNGGLPGVSTVPTALDALVGLLNGNYSPPVALTDAATINYVASASDNFTLLLTSAVGATRQLAVPSALSAGMRWVVRVTQPATGGPCNVTFPATYKFPFGIVPEISPTADAIDSISCYYDGTNIIAQVVNSFGTVAPIAVEGGTLKIDGSLNLANEVIAVNTTLDETHYTIAVNALAAPVTITLPNTATAGVDGRVYMVKKIDASANAVIIQRSGGDLIDGAASTQITTLYQTKRLHARTNGNAWDLIG